MTTAQACVSAFVSIKLLNIFDVATFSSQKLGSFCCDFGTFPARFEEMKQATFSLFSSSKFQPKRNVANVYVSVSSSPVIQTINNNITN